MDMKCTVIGCQKPAKARNLCSMHYERARKSGAQTAGPGTRHGAPHRFLDDVVRTWHRDDCLLWPYSMSDAGYGVIWIEGKMQRVSRLICEENHGPAPSAKHEAAHSCGKGHRGCVNRHHLHWATPSENQLERAIHGTSNRGERHGHAKLTAAQVQEIRKLAGVQSRPKTAAEFGVHTSTVQAIQNGSAWKWLVGAGA